MNLKMVILDCPYNTWNSNKTRELFNDIVALRFEGYKSQYRDGIIPVNDTDFVGIHKVICEETNGKLIPLLGNLSLTYDRAVYHNMVFPGLSLVQASKSPSHIQAMTEILELCSKTGKVICYDGSYVMAPHIKKDRATTVKLHRIFQAFKVHFLTHYKIKESITAATVKFNVEKVCRFWGYEPFESEGKRLADIPVARVDQGLVTMMHLKAIASEALQGAKEYQSLWDDRIVLEASKTQSEAMAA